MKKLIGLAVLSTLLVGCETMQKKEEAPAPVAAKPAPEPVAPAKKLSAKEQAAKDAADKKAAAAAASKKSAAPTADAGKPQEVKGINGWSGQIIGTPAPKSKFNNLKIGMGFNEVISVVGKPTDTSSHITGKAWIPFYFGSGRYETVFYYKGLGRLTFAGGAGAYTYGVNDNSGLTIIEHDKTERGFQ
ncbi:hypothetical protein [Oxalicibacterium faecigallinarum]|uniref:Lipoprotein n=1 Tax=Oxalicibacterium faecigallinarum TaxID=573741 RepID=A0A8J3F1U6_9BURK|nr:hypothetical protein [Oxalicibacterium faecigallinarum]GGI20022.1 hypothetical protein GCM10008066_21950 [Oxalicibacterium faecigallinarum]